MNYGDTMLRVMFVYFLEKRHKSPRVSTHPLNELKWNCNRPSNQTKFSSFM